MIAKLEELGLIPAAGGRVSAVADATDHLIKPARRHARRPDRASGPDGVESLELVTLTSRELSDLDMLASGALSPLEGFMGQADYERVVEDMRLANGLPWSLPVCLAVDAAPQGDRVALADESGRLLAVLEVEETSTTYDKEREAELLLPHDRHRASRASRGSTSRSRSTSPAG